LKDAASQSQLWGDWALLLLVQGLPLLLVGVGLGAIATGHSSPTVWLGFSLNLLLLLIRVGLNFAIAPSYDFSQASGRWLFWLSPLADPLAVLRIFLSSLQTPRRWRGRDYSSHPASAS
jgi:dolichol-phosphate mannosyltransferase